MVYVKTTYGEASVRLPNISKYLTRKDANSFVKTCLEWGIDIVSCKIVSASEAKRLIAGSLADTYERM